MNFAETMARRKLRVATTSLAGCFGCHMSFLDIDERLFTLLEHVEFDRSPLTDIKHCGPCDIGFIEGGMCSASSVSNARSSSRSARAR
jgi:NAD-reducing hydrogenase small subunit